MTDFSAPSRRRSGLRGAGQLCRWPYLGVRVPGLQEDLIVEGLPLRVVAHRHSKLPDAGHQVLGDALLVSLLATDSILQLDTNTETIQVQCHQSNHAQRVESCSFGEILHPLKCLHLTWSTSGLSRASPRSRLRKRCESYRKVLWRQSRTYCSSRQLFSSPSSSESKSSDSARSKSTVKLGQLGNSCFKY